MSDQDTVRVLVVLERPGQSELVTWTPVTERWRARDMVRDWGHAEWYDGSPVGWDPCDDPGCERPEHVLRVKRALIVDQAS